MNKISIKKIRLWLATGFLSLSISAPTNALIPVTDIANLAENIAGNIQDLYNWVEQKRLMLMQMDQIGISSEMDVDNTNNAIANVIIRTGKATQEVQNIEILEKSVPDKDACGTIAVQAVQKEESCFSADRVVAQLDSFHKKNGNYDASAGEQQKQQKEIAKKIVTECEALQVGETDPKNPMQSTLCTRASLITGGETTDTYDEKQSKAVQKYIELIAGPAPSPKTSASFEGAPEAKRQIMAAEMRKEAFKATVYTSLTEIAAMRESADHKSPSVLESLQAFDNERFGSADWIATIGNVNPEPGKKNSVYESELIRKIAAMDMFLVHMSLLQYKQSLRAEVLQAADLAYTLNPAK